jgi:PAS domain S-box-containing protein
MAQPEGALFETLHQRKSGEVFPVEISSRAIEIGGKLYRQSFVRDITVRQRTDAKLKRNLQLLAEAQRIAQVGNWELDVANSRVNGSEEFFVIHGIEQGNLDLDLRTFLDFPQTDDRPRLRQWLDELLAGKMPGEVEFRSAAANDGDERWIRMRGTLVLDADGRPATVTGTTQDISKERRNQERLTRQLDELRRWQRVMLDRETRVLALKREVNALLVSTGQPPRYAAAARPDTDE